MQFAEVKIDPQSELLRDEQFARDIAAGTSKILSDGGIERFAQLRS